jgi:hypoxanthine phosphoribosyltransferase
MTYDELKANADKLHDKIEAEIEGDYQLVAVSRGGVTLAHRIAVRSGRPLNFYSPKTNTLAWPPRLKTLVFIEDLVALGRTHTQVKDMMGCWYRDTYTENQNWFFCPLIVDAKFAAQNQPLPFKIYGSVESDWIVFPYEDYEKVHEGDHGLFRDGSGKYGKPT